MCYVQASSKPAVLLSSEKTYENSGIKMDVWKRKFSPGCCVYSLLQWSKLEKSSDCCKLEGSAGVIFSAHSHVHFPPPLNSIKVISETFSETHASVYHETRYLPFGIKKRYNICFQEHFNFLRRPPFLRQTLGGGWFPRHLS